MRFVNCPSCGGGNCGWQFQCDVCEKQGAISEEAAEAYRLASRAQAHGAGAVFRQILAWKRGAGDSKKSP